MRGTSSKPPYELVAPDTRIRAPSTNTSGHWLHAALVAASMLHAACLYTYDGDAPDRPTTRDGAPSTTKPGDDGARDHTPRSNGDAGMGHEGSSSDDDPDVRRDAGLASPHVDAGEGVDGTTRPDPALRDVTFFVTSDTHIGRPDGDAKAASLAMIEAMHATEGAAYPSELGLGNVGTPRGVAITGDLTDDNRIEQWSEFDDLWGANGEGAVRYPVFEGWGNHDLHGDRPDVRNAVLERHARRDQDVNVAPGDGAHYSWDWHDVHLVHLNLYPGIDGGLSIDSPDLYNPRGSLSFLHDDLEARVGTSGRPVVLFFHFGMDEGGLRGWSAQELDDFFEVIAPYNVVGTFVGHSHAQKFEDVHSVLAGADGTSHAMYMADDTLSAGSGRKTGFYVVHLGPHDITVAERTLDAPSPWGFVRKTAIEAP